mmetsp:Transcript_21559/g.51456  ORF Transcript_21559/g.51456 Transcript_21559/m.51456 type:complete len:235 (+) Transcript_21559:536-1240(+)
MRDRQRGRRALCPAPQGEHDRHHRRRRQPDVLVLDGGAGPRPGGGPADGRVRGVLPRVPHLCLPAQPQAPGQRLGQALAEDHTLHSGAARRTGGGAAAAGAAPQQEPRAGRGGRVGDHSASEGPHGHRCAQHEDASEERQHVRGDVEGRGAAERLPVAHHAARDAAPRQHAGHHLRRAGAFLGRERGLPLRHPPQPVRADADGGDGRRHFQGAHPRGRCPLLHLHGDSCFQELG